MLLSKPITVGETVSIKLITGEELIARLEEENNDNVKLTKPLLVTVGPQGLGMMPFMFLNGSDTVSIKQTLVLAMGIAKQDAADARARKKISDMGYKKGGSVSSASRRADGIATKGKTRGKMV